MWFDHEFTSFVNSLVNSTSQDPGWVRLHGIPLDYRYYFTNKFMNPVCDLLEPLIKNRDAIFGEFLSSKRKVCWDAKQPKIADYFKKVPTSCGAT